MDQGSSRGSDNDQSCYAAFENNGENEFGMGQMARINEDSGTGGWDTFSDRNRGLHFDYWSQCTTAFEGLIYWSKIFADHNMIMDADMLTPEYLCK